MPCVTYYSDSEVRHHQERLNDKDIQELLDEVKSRTGETWFVRKDDYQVKRGLLRKPRIVTLYEILADCHGEWQIINFPPDEQGGWSINHDVSRAKIITYLLGYLGGWRQGQRALSRSTDRAPE